MFLVKTLLVMVLFLVKVLGAMKIGCCHLAVFAPGFCLESPAALAGMWFVLVLVRFEVVQTETSGNQSLH